MTLNCVKLGRAVTFMKYLASVVSLIFPAKTLIWNEITLPASDLLSFAELVEKEPLKSIYKLGSDDEILSSLIKKAWRTCIFLSHFREINEELLCTLFL